MLNIVHTSPDALEHISGRSEFYPSLLDPRGRIVAGLADRAAWLVPGIIQGTR
jgi:hypothetical protein